jgi:hypothetical protein
VLHAVVCGVHLSTCPQQLCGNSFSDLPRHTVRAEPPIVAMFNTMLPGSRVGQMIAAMVLTYAAAFVAITLRIFSRRLVRAKLRFDDYTAIGAFVCFCSIGGCCSFLTYLSGDCHCVLWRQDPWSDTVSFVNYYHPLGRLGACLLTSRADIHYGLGRHLEDIHHSVYDVNFQIRRGLISADFMYPFICGLAKFSILALFWRLFECSRTSKLAIKILFVMSGSWWAARASTLLRRDSTDC